MKGSRGWGLGFSRIIALIFGLFVFLYPIPYTLYPVYADVDISKTFGFGEFRSLGEATSKLVTPIFSIAAAAVVLYFLFGAFKFIQSRGNKEEVAAAQNIIIHAVIGFIILMFAFLILQFLLSSLFNIKEGFRIIG